MGTGINYLDEGFNAVTGCSGKKCKVKENCWAREMVKRFPLVHGVGPFEKVQFHPDRLDKPRHWRKPRRVGLCFCGDWMDDQVQCEWIDEILEVIAACPQHQFFSLTKQPQNLAQKIYGFCEERFCRELGGGDYLPNLWNGVSVCDQEDADLAIPELLKIPGKHWGSAEPLLGPINFTDFLPCITIGGVELENWPLWVVVGCESGPKRRPCPLEWVESIVDQCQAFRVPIWIKQLDIEGRCVHDINQFPEHVRIRQLPDLD